MKMLNIARVIFRKISFMIAKRCVIVPQIVVIELFNEECNIT
jgi:hypothetical protein